ncbi:MULTISPECIES: hypothetical protein [unclassified Variovorax]|uniref:hypothetical protein n=1 Tax=unclassified Variovorax TaxID=663243 RepID=UPI001BD592A2|nr:MULTISPECIES: hypothetical protein [unclassified Variovorax]
MPSAQITTVSRPEPTPVQKGMVLACALLFIAGLVYASKLPPFLPDEFLLALAWKYSALLSIPLAYLLLHANRDRHMPKGPYLVILPFVLYFGLAQFVLFVPDLLAGFTSGPGASRIVSVSQVQENSTICGKQAHIEVAGYSPVSFDLCVSQALAQTLLAGDKLLLEGKAGLGGLLVLRQVKL